MDPSTQESGHASVHCSSEKIPQVALSLLLGISHCPAILDFEGTVPFGIVLKLRRGSGDLSQPMNIMTSGLVFDIPYAFSKGLLKWIDLDRNELIGLSPIDTTPHPDSGP